ncbi:MAG: ATP-binding protein [Solirubrobacteraceae bacterium]
MAAPGVVGRERELAEIDGFLEALPAGFAALALEGEAGIGKTTLWREALLRASRGGALVLACRSALAEAKLSFAALADLLSEVDESAFAALPAPQREALEVALLRISPTRRAAARPVAAGFLGLIRGLATVRPVVVAVDDWQWLDRPTREALEFAARRLDSERVGLVCSVRAPLAGALIGGAVTDERLRRVAVGPLSLAGLGRILSGRLGRPLSRPLLVRIATSTGATRFTRSRSRACSAGSAEGAPPRRCCRCRTIFAS